jgi:hypothetical protein
MLRLGKDVLSPRPLKQWTGNVMAKGQKKSNKEIRKPKATKVAATAGTPLFAKGALTPGSGTGKK